VREKGFMLVLSLAPLQVRFDKIIYNLGRKMLVFDFIVMWMR
jgi:hypothetical protein